ncbi:MAG: 4-(cytidine 5'-diphospho)-2-C-methyl-D-erythritol kinase [Alphaproteobacteria bacterium]
MTADSADKSLKIFAPAKINLFLHVTGKRADGYHTLESLISFANIGDTLTLSAAKEPALSMSGPFAKSFKPAELDSSPQSKNLLMKALWGLSRLYKRPPSFHVLLEKNLPLSAGIGGGSADAAALIWGVLSQWGTPPDQDEFDQFLLSLGADTPVCLHSSAAFVSGIGDNIKKMEHIPEMPIVLVNPLKPCPTASVFKALEGQYCQPVSMPKHFNDAHDLSAFLKKQNNCLEKSAQDFVPDIENILNALRYANGCLLSRMSGSGASCFGLFDTTENAQKARHAIAEENPDWWAEDGILGETFRY